MRHRKVSARLSRPVGHREGMLRNMVTSLLQEERIQTTRAKAKVLRGWAERMITLGKRGDLHARRQALQVVRSGDVVYKLFSELSERFKARPGGYTRIVHLGVRHGDNAALSIIELLPGEKPTVQKGEATEKTKSTRAKKPSAKASKPSKAQTKKAASKK